MRPRPPISSVPLSIIAPSTGAELEIELTNACMVRLKGVIDPLLLHPIDDLDPRSVNDRDRSQQGSSVILV